MNVKTLTAPTIHAALIEARRLLGDDVVLLESIPPQNGQLARITVMADQAMPQRATAPTPARVPAPRRLAPARPAPQPTAAYAHAGAVTEQVAPGGERFSAYEDDDEDDYTLSPEAQALLARRFGGDGSSHSARPDVRPTGGSPRGTEVQLARRSGNAPTRGRLFPEDPEQTTLPVPASGPTMEALEELLQNQLQFLHQRLDAIERRFEQNIIGASQRWTVHPLFGELLEQGMRPGTVTALFQTLAGKGYQPDTNESTLRWALAQEMRRTLDVATPKNVHGAQVFIGPSGSGKTSLLLKLARHPGFYGRRKTAVIVIGPDHEDGLFYQSPIDVYRRHGLPVTTVRSVDEMRQAILRVQHFDHVLIDTPPMPLHEGAARKMLVHIKKMVDPILPLHVQLVLNATRALDDLDAETLQRLPLRPDAVALTHLDETRGWGRIAEWMMALKMPIQFVSTSSRVPDGAVAFSASWFVEEMMKL